MPQAMEDPAAAATADPMAAIYYGGFYVLVLMTVLLAWNARPRGEKMSDEQSGLAKSYLAVWYICVAGDWLQGPYVYALYDAYGFPRSEIAQLFVAGFGASMVFGTFVGSWTDTIGRKRACQLYCILYILSCGTKHFNHYWVLMVGRITGGIATSLLFSAFESWLVCEHGEKRNLPGAGLGHIFAWMWFGNSFMGILAGLVGDQVVALGGMTRFEALPACYVGGFISAFDLASFLLIIGFCVISVSWGENYGKESTAVAERESLGELFMNGLRQVFSSQNMLVLMVVVAAFEGCMYTFVFNWTPALKNSFSTPAFGTVFACFMMCYMSGSSVFELLTANGVSDPLTLLKSALMSGAMAFLIPAFAFGQLAVSVGQMSVIYVGFLVFEFCCGLYFPSVSTLKSQTVPEQHRATIYNIYRVPMNGIVLIVLLNDISMMAVFYICFGLLVTAVAMTFTFSQAPKDFDSDKVGLVSGGNANANGEMRERIGKASYDIEKA